MNGYPQDRELPELNDDQIVLLDAICKAASASTRAPFKALTDEYARHFEEKGLDTSRDNAVYRWILRVGESARRAYRLGQRTDYVPYLRSILESHGITVLDDTQSDEVDGVTRSLEGHNPVERRQPVRRPRRVSFDDARLEETWLSERSQLTNPSTFAPPGTPLKQPPRRASGSSSRPRAPSASSDRHYLPRQPAPKHFQDASPSSQYTSDYEEPQNPTLFFPPSMTQLELNAEAFLATSELRTARHLLHMWHDKALALQHQRKQSYAEASEVDRSRLLRESFGTWYAVYAEVSNENAHLMHLDEILYEHEQRKQFQLLDKTFSHWLNSWRYQSQAQAVSNSIIVRNRLFRHWRRLTVDNNTTARCILSRRVLSRWRKKTADRLWAYEGADARYEENLERTSLRQLLRTIQERRVLEHHEGQMARRAFGKWRSLVERQRSQKREADDWHGRRVAHSIFQTLASRAKERQEASLNAQNHFSRKLATGCVHTLRLQAKLTPLAATLSLKVTLNLKRKAFRVWHLHLTLTQQASEVDRKRVVQSAWTSWNDALRCKALAQRIDERVLIESLRNWVLQARLQSFRRGQNERFLRRTVAAWSRKLQNRDAVLEDASVRFAECQRWRSLKYGMVRLNMARRSREDAERAAIEFSNSRALPDVLNVWTFRTEHSRKLAKWAADARFYCLSTRTLKVWSERAVEQRHQRRREAYAHVRGRVKTRLVRDCFQRLRDKSAQMTIIHGQAAGRAQARVFGIGSQGFDMLRQKAAQHADLTLRANAADQQKLLASAFSTLVNYYADLAAMEQQALLFGQQADLALQAAALRKVQWVTFTAARRVESADALQARNRDLYLKQMLRHWASQASVRKGAKTTREQQDPDSPSLRPASRAASRSADRPAFGSSPQGPTSTPAYMRTPSRSRRAGRFRPLPTPAHVTPMAFERSYLVTTPAPPATAQPGEEEEAGERSDVFEGLTPQVTPFARKLRAGGVTPVPPSALRSSILGRSMAAGGTNKSVRFAGSSRFGTGRRKLDTTDE